jgi:parallel beta-helix repeat protein
MQPFKGFSFFVMVIIVFISACSSAIPQTVDQDLSTWDDLEGSEATLAAAALTAYYVSGTGSDSNSGLSSATPFRTLQRAADLTNPGDIVWIMDGTYTNSAPDSTILNIARSGTAGNYIRYRAFPGHKPVLKATKNWLAIKVDGAAYILIEGLTVIGNNDAVTEAQALTQFTDTNGDGKPDSFNAKPEYAGNGIGIYFKDQNYAQPSHHVIIRNNTVQKFGGGGIESYGADFLVIEDNRVNSNSWYSPYDNSGISVYQNRDTQPDFTGYRFVIRRNVSRNNRNFMPNLNTSSFPGGPFPTDGNGIIIDDSKNGQSDGRPPENGMPQDFGPYTGKMLVANNLVYDNFGRGIHVFESDNVTVLNNTSVSNSHDVDINEGEITVMNSDGVRVYNNILAPYQDRSAITNKNYRSAATGNLNVVIDYNLSFGGTGFFDPQYSDPVSTNHNGIGLDPLFINAANKNFKLRASSPAIDKGLVAFNLKDDLEKSLRPKGVSVDVGAYEIR